MNTIAFDWDGLLECIEDRLVIPIVGSELLTVRRQEGTVLLHELLAVELARAFNLSMEGGDPIGLNRVACRLLQQGVFPQRLYSRLAAIYRELAPAPPEPLLALAGVTGFSLFVSTTPDDLLARALDHTRHGGAALTRALVYSIHGEMDLPASGLPDAPPTVFQLFGKISPAADYVLTERDLLESVRTLQTPNKRPQRLFDHLRGKHILVLGCGFPDWLARFFLELVTDIWSPAQRIAKTLIDSCAADEGDLVLFLTQCGVEVHPELGSAEFALELGRRWRVRHPEPSAAEAARNEEPACASAGERALERGTVFISYASEDLAAAQRLAARLTEIGVTVWFDKDQLEGGDLYRSRIQRHIGQCAMFLPLISKNSAGRTEGFYREEWAWALARARRFRPDYPFIQPLAIDEADYRVAGLPDEFYELHWTRLAGGEPTPEFLKRMRDFVRELRSEELV